MYVFRYDESLWRCVDMTKANLPPGLLGKVLKRGTRVLRLAQAKVRKKHHRGVDQWLSGYICNHFTAPPPCIMCHNLSIPTQLSWRVTESRPLPEKKFKEPTRPKAE